MRDSNFLRGDEFELREIWLTDSVGVVGGTLVHCLHDRCVNHVDDKLLLPTDVTSGVFWDSGFAVAGGEDY